MKEGDDLVSYRWETGYEKTWEEMTSLDDLEEDGALPSNIVEILKKSKRRKLEQKTVRNRLGLMRQLFIIVDCSEAMSVTDFRPTRIHCATKWLQIFAQEYVIANPISQIGIIALKGKRAELMSDLTGSVKQHIEALEKMQHLELQSEISLFNGLNLALKSLRISPKHISREVIIIMASLGTCDPGDINEIISELKQCGIRVSVITLSAEMHICRKMAQITDGSYCAVINTVHFRSQLMTHLDPPPSTNNQNNTLVKMGFPHGANNQGKHASLSMCMCHLSRTDMPSKVSARGYYCPQCSSKYCELPVECVCCGLMLITALHLARSYHHLFPAPLFTEVSYNGQAAVCYSCQRVFKMSVDKNVYRCQYCSQIYCRSCDIFIHEALHSCVGCKTLCANPRRMMITKAATLTDQQTDQQTSAHVDKRNTNAETLPDTL